MTRRVLAVLLALILALLLCEIHVCSGEDCLFCARLQDFHRLVVCVFFIVCFASCARFSYFLMRRAVRTASVFPFSLIDLKVRLSD